MNEPARSPGVGRRLPRRSVLLAIAVIAGLWLAAGVRQLDPDSEFGVVDGPLLPGGAVRVESAWALAPPLMFELTRYPLRPVELEMPGAADAMLRGVDGSRYGFRGQVTLAAQDDRWRALHAAADGAGLPGVLVDAVVEASRELPPGAETGVTTAAFARALNNRLDEELDRRGIELRRFTLEGLDFLMADPDVPVEPSDAKLLVIGLDGADWELLDPLLEQGRMPHLAGLIERGVRAKLLTISPTLSPVIWTTVSTGVEPGRHGILDFLTPASDGGGGQPVTSAQRRVPTVWETLSERGVSCGVIAWWASWPAEPVGGYLVSDRIAYQLFGFRSDLDDAEGKTWPPELYEEVVRPRIVAPDEIEWSAVRPYLGADLEPSALEEGERKRLEDFRTLLASGRTYVDLALTLRERFDPALEVVYLEGTDTVGHLFMPFRAPRLPGIDERRFEAYRDVVDRYYETADAHLGELLEGRGEDWTVMVLSDHGFASDATRPRMTDSRIGHGAAADWHRRFGMIVLSGAHVQAGARLDEASVYDVAPTVMALFGQPVPQSWPGQVLGRALDPEFLDRHPVRYTVEDPPRGTWMAGGTPEDPAAAAVVEKLRSLGYVDAGEAPTEPADAGGSGANNRGVALMSAGRLAEAEDAFRAGLAEQPRNPTLLANLGNALRLQRRHDEAREVLRQAFDFVATRRVAGHLLAQIALENGEAARAESLLRTVLQAEPEAADVRTTLGSVLEAGGRYADAEAEYRRAAGSDANAAKPRNHLGNLARRGGDPAAAERWYRAAIDADPYFMGAYNNLALVLQDRGEMDGAIELYSQALTKAPNNAVVLNNLASLYYAQGDYDEAAALWRRAMRTNPAYPSPYNNLASLEIQEERYDEAEELLRRALDLEPEYGDAHLNLALIHRVRNDRGRMVEALGRAAEDPRARPRALSQLGLLSFEEGDYEAAATTLMDAVANGARDTSTLNVLGECHRLMGHMDDAAQAWRTSLSLDPGQSELRERLALLRDPS
jgi:Tfp pilus assembly protein PilF/predicted AlkP superfamily phosphohydrolase/phosphomutase